MPWPTAKFSEHDSWTGNVLVFSTAPHGPRTTSSHLQLAGSRHIPYSRSLTELEILKGPLNGSSRPTTTGDVGSGLLGMSFLQQSLGLAELLRQRFWEHELGTGLLVRDGLLRVFTNILVLEQVDGFLGMLEAKHVTFRGMVSRCCGGLHHL